jgi:hypothetical protein
MASTWQQLIFDALLEIGVYSSNDALLAEDLAQGTRRLNRILDTWSARKVYAYSQTFQLYTLVPNTAPYLIGPNLTSPNFATPNASVRPVRIDSIALVLTNVAPSVDVPLNPRDAAWWRNQRIKSLATNVPTDYYYEPDFPSGAIFFWPVPNFAYGARCELWTSVGQVPTDTTQTFTAPPGYELATMLTLAEESCGPYTRPVPADLPEKARRARAALESNNAKSPRIASADFGTRGSSSGSAGGRRGDFNYRSGGPS